MIKSPKVLVVATSRKTRGGITSVVKAHETGEQWKKFHCHWVQTHRDGPKWRKIAYFISGMIDFLVRLPFYDIVHIHVASYGSLRRKMPFLRLSKIFGKKTIAHFHPHKPEVLFEECTKKDYIDFFSSVDRVLVLSAQWKRWIKEALIDNRPLQIYHLGDDPNVKLYPVDKKIGNKLYDKIEILYNPAPKVKPIYKHKNYKYILFAGILYYRKGFDTLIKAFGKIAHKYPDWKIVLAGHPKMEKDAELMKTLPKALNIESQVIFPGWISGESKSEWFSNASIFCLASYQEGFPMAVLDAWAYGLPCVVTPAGGIPDIVEDGKEALMFEFGDINGLASQLDRLLSDENLRHKISKESEILASNIFNINRINSQLSNLYEELSQ